MVHLPSPRIGLVGIRASRNDRSAGGFTPALEVGAELVGATFRLGRQEFTVDCGGRLYGAIGARPPVMPQNEVLP
jgi:hypothetical protein